MPTTFLPSHYCTYYTTIALLLLTAKSYDYLLVVVLLVVVLVVVVLVRPRAANRRAAISSLSTLAPPFTTPKEEEGGVVVVVIAIAPYPPPPPPDCPFPLTVGLFDPNKGDCLLGFTPPLTCNRCKSDNPPPDSSAIWRSDDIPRADPPDPDDPAPNRLSCCSRSPLLGRPIMPSVGGKV